MRLKSTIIHSVRYLFFFFALITITSQAQTLVLEKSIQWAIENKDKPKVVQPMVFEKTMGTKLKQSIQKDLKRLYQFQYDDTSPLHQVVFGKVTDFEKWLNSRISIVRTDPSFSGAGVVAMVDSFEPSEMRLTPNYETLNMPLIARLSVFIHEARHTETENDSWHHSKCPTPFKNSIGEDERGFYSGALLAGELACDTFALGGYGISVVFSHNIETNCNNCNEKTKVDAALLKEQTLVRVISKEAAEELKTDFAPFAKHR